MAMPDALQKALEAKRTGDPVTTITQTTNSFATDEDFDNPEPDSDEIEDLSPDYVRSLLNRETLADPADPTDPTDPADPADPADNLDELFANFEDPIPDNVLAFPDLDDNETNDESDDELSAVMQELQKLQNKLDEKDQDDEFEQQVNQAIAALENKYGEADPEIFENFKDLFAVMRAKIGPELEASMIRENAELKRRLKQIEDKFEKQNSLQKKEDVKPTKSDMVAYRDLMAEAIPNYTKVVSSPQFRKLLKTPVDNDNPGFTYNDKLGKLFKEKRTSDIIKFFTTFDERYLSKKVGEKPVVVDSGVNGKNTAVTKPKGLTPEVLRDIFKQVMSGKLDLTPDEISQLRAEMAKLTKSK